LPAAGTALAYDERCLLHDNGSMVVDPRASGWIDVLHAENALRVSRAMRVLEQAGVAARLERLEPRVPTDEELLAVHTERHLEALRAVEPGSGVVVVGPEARAGKGSVEAAMLAAGAAIEAVDFVLRDGHGRRAYSLTRPPGHHASADQAMGFCLLNSAAIAARYAQRKHGIARVAILDWDVHHGNGTEDIFGADPSVLFVSLHQDGLYPADRGRIGDRGEGDGTGTTVNVPLPAGTGDEGYLAAVERVALPAIERFAPGLIVLSSGQDAGACDPLGRMSVTADGFRAMTGQLAGLADRVCDGRLVAVQEGGYSLDHMPFCVLATIEALAGLNPALDRDPVEMDVPSGVSPAQDDAVRDAAAAAGLA
jgi:acetoin utilization deacetylase AcuC-like enzyme